MLKVRNWACILVAIVVTIVPTFAVTNEAAAANTSSAATAANPEPAATPVTPSPAPVLVNSNMNALLGALVSKGVFTPSEVRSIQNATPDAEFQLLVQALTRKGLVTAADLSAAGALSPAATAPAAATSGQLAGPLAQEAKPAGPTLIPAVAPLRVLPLDPPVKDGLVPGFKIGAVKVTPYGFIKATVVRDSSSPNGDDFPFPGIFLNSSSPFDTGPNKNPSFHIKARSTRFGSNFEWPDLTSKLTLTGKIEGDLEGNFSGVDNADVSSIRNPGPRLRLAYVRLDYAATEKSDIFFEGGQNWTLFGSSALPNILETTFLGAYSGDIWDRSPQFRFGLVQKLGGDRNFKFSPEVALMMPSTGQIYKLNGTVGGFEAQIGEGERQGADSGRPELEARTVLQFQLDRAPGVAPAQLIWAGYNARRTGITTYSNIATAPYNLGGQYESGFSNSSSLYGNQLAVQLPTRWVTLVVSAYRGADMRFMLGGQLNTFYTDTRGLYDVWAAPTVDNVGVSGSQMLGCTVPVPTGSTCAGAGGTWQLAKQRPIGAFGGFINVGLPLSRWFNANPKGHNAGWQLYLHAGKDQVVHGDLRRALGFGCTSADAVQPTPCNGGIPLSQSRLVAGTLYYKLNQWVSFVVEQSQYQTRLVPEVGPLYLIAGKSSPVWKNQRTEIGPIFSF
ncbi:MAG TPA: hypothetical protein VF011_18300 [Terriglobales bacterium]